MLPYKKLKSDIPGGVLTPFQNTTYTLQLEIHRIVKVELYLSYWDNAQYNSTDGEINLFKKEGSYNFLLRDKNISVDDTLCELSFQLPTDTLGISNVNFVGGYVVPCRFYIKYTDLYDSVKTERINYVNALDNINYDIMYIDDPISSIPIPGDTTPVITEILPDRINYSPTGTELMDIEITGEKFGIKTTQSVVKFAHAGTSNNIYFDGIIIEWNNTYINVSIPSELKPFPGETKDIRVIVSKSQDEVSYPKIITLYGELQ